MTESPSTSPLAARVPGTKAVAELLARLEPWAASREVSGRIREILPSIADPARALANLEALLAAAVEPEAPILEPLLRVLGGSQTLSSVLLAVPGAGLRQFEESLGRDRVEPVEHVAELLDAIRRLGAAEGIHSLASSVVPAHLRQHKRRHILRIGARDLLGLAPVEDTFRELSSLAEGEIEVAYRHARACVAADFGVFAPPDDLRFVVLGMGKLGGGELNFSSDIDLVYLYDGGGGGSLGGPRGSLNAQTYASRVAEIVTRALSEVREEGIVFRVDLRLRPDGQSGPIVNSLAGALVYYESFGQTWERTAMLKARPLAGDLALGHEFLREMAPFVYRRYLDFATVEEIREMKVRVNREHSRARLERDVKLGLGGIREVEFIVQVLQLVHGGRDERLRSRSTLDTLRALADVGVVTRDESEQLAAAYRFLRDVEHKIQIVHERQTHLLPDDPEEERVLARRLGYHLTTELEEASTEDAVGAEIRRLRADLTRHRTAVRQSFEKLFSGAEIELGRSADEEVSTLLQNLNDRDPSCERLGAMGFRDPEAAVENLLRLRDGPRFSPASPRRRKALLSLAPALLAEIRKASDPDLALHHMAELVSAIGARTSFLALLRENPETLRLLIGLFGSSEYLSKFFLRHPELLDSLVRADLAVIRKERSALERDLSGQLQVATDYEATLDTLRRFRNEEFLRVGVNDIHGLLEFGEVSEQLSDLAEVCLEAALRIALRSIEERYGAAPGRFSVIGMGKLGARELNYNSDLDLIFVYDGSADGRTTISVHEYFTKVAQRLMTVLQLTTREGLVYRIDTRLRPSGSHGPLVSSIESFREYHRTSSALWERQALIRARGVAGDPALVNEVESIIERFVYGRGLDAAGVAEIARLRARMEHELAGESIERWNVKTGRGGILDVEFLTQMLQLRHGQDHPAVRLRQTEAALEALSREGLLSDEDHHALVGGYRFLRRLENRMRIERDQAVEALERAGARPGTLARRLGYGGSPEEAAAELFRDFERIRESVRSTFRKHFGDVAA